MKVLGAETVKNEPTKQIQEAQVVVLFGLIHLIHYFWTILPSKQTEDGERRRVSINMALVEELEDRFRSSLRIYEGVAISLPEVGQAPSMVVVVDQVADLS